MKQTQILSLVLVISSLASHFNRAWSCSAETQSYLDTVGVEAFSQNGIWNNQFADYAIDGNFGTWYISAQIANDESNYLRIDLT